MRKSMKQLPYFMMFIYPAKMDVYKKRSKKIKELKKSGKEDELADIKLNAYHSPSPMNELAVYMCRWEERNFTRNIVEENQETYNLLINHAIEIDNQVLRSKIKKIMLNFIKEFNKELDIINKYAVPDYTNIDLLFDSTKRSLLEICPNIQELTNYVVDISYSSKTASKLLCWKLFGEQLIQNIKNNSDHRVETKIVETTYDFDGTKEFLGKKYLMIEEVKNNEDVI